MILEADKKGIEEAAAVLRAGGVIGYPTETVYGLGCDPGNRDAVKRIRSLKGRDGNKPMILLVPNVQQVENLCQFIPDKAGILMDTFWPGPMTLVIPGSKNAPDSVISPEKTIAVRISPDPVCLQLMKVWKHPIVSTSANLSGMEPAISANEVEDYFRGHIDLILDGGLRKEQNPSTLVNLSGSQLRILREGAISGEKILNVWRHG